MNTYKKTLFCFISCGILMIVGCGKTETVSNVKTGSVFGVLKKGALKEQKFRLKSGKMAYLPTIQIAASANYYSDVIRQIIPACKRDFMENVANARDIDAVVNCRGSSVRDNATWFYDVQD